MDEEIVQPEVMKPERKKPGRKPKTEVAPPDFMALIKDMQRQNLEAMERMIQEVKKPSELDQRKLDKEENELKRKQADRQSHMTADVKRKQMRMQNCQHASVIPATGKSKHTWNGQVHTPATDKPYSTPTCQKCQTQLPRIYATSDQLQNGMRYEEYIGLNIDILLKWAESSGNVDGVAQFRKEYKVA